MRERELVIGAVSAMICLPASLPVLSLLCVCPGGQAAMFN